VWCQGTIFRARLFKAQCVHEERIECAKGWSYGESATKGNVLAVVCSFDYVATMTTFPTWMIGICVAIILFCVGVYITRRQARIDRVVKEYLEAARQHPPKIGLESLLNCSVIELKNGWEMDDVCRRIVAAGQSHPNYLEYEKMSPRKLLRFMKYCHKNGYKLNEPGDRMMANETFNGTFSRD
jgi:hypothetical protein